MKKLFFITSFFFLANVSLAQFHGVKDPVSCAKYFKAYRDFLSSEIPNMLSCKSDNECVPVENLAKCFESCGGEWVIPSNVGSQELYKKSATSKFAKDLCAKAEVAECTDEQFLDHCMGTYRSREYLKPEYFVAKCVDGKCSVAEKGR